MTAGVERFLVSVEDGNIDVNFVVKMVIAKTRHLILLINIVLLLIINQNGTIKFYFNQMIHMVSYLKSSGISCERLGIGSGFPSAMARALR